MNILKNVFRRKVRAVLTIFGIVIGILALVMMGSIAEKLTLMVDGGIEYYGDKVTVSDAKSGAISGFTTVPISTDKIAELEKVEGVARASDGRIIRQFLAEAAVIGLIGGALGLLGGWLLTVALNKAGAENNMAVFLLTPRLAIGSVLFSLVIGIISGLYPAWHAARLDPIKALRYE
jgi:ABC-type antimicrobial peptide transport system permease subunit